MKRRLIYCLLVFAFCTAASFSTNAQSSGPDAAVKAKQQVQLLGQGAKVVVEMDNGRRLKGRITQVDDDSFDLKQTGSGQTISVAYSNVAKITQPKGISRKHWTLIGVGAAVVVVAVVASKAKKRGPFCFGCGPLF